MHKGYICPALRELRDQQVRFAPREKKLEQAERAEQLLHELNPDRIYTYDYLCYRITRFRPDRYPGLKVKGADARHDLILLIEDLSEAARLPAEEIREQILTLPEVARVFNVCPKTIARWRRWGLVAKRVILGGRNRVVFTESAIRRFLEKNARLVERGAHFSQMSEEERRMIIDRARELALTGARPSEVARQIAAETGRSPETIRYTLKEFDEQHPDLCIFPDKLRPLTEEEKRRIYQQFRHGQSAAALAKEYGRSKSTIYRIVAEMRAKRILELPLDYIYSPEFDQIKTPEQEREILGPPPPSPQPARPPRIPPGLPPYLASLYEVPLLTKEQEIHLFRKMNYLKYKASKLREKLDPSRPKVKLMEEIEKLYEQAVATKNQIVSANLRLVVSIAKRHVGPGSNFFELVSDGNMSLIRAVEKFDYTRGNKFSTYASWAIMKNFARTIPDEQRHRERFRTSQNEMFNITEDIRSDQYERETAQMLRERQVEKILARLDPREQQIIISRFGLGDRREPLTLKQVGAELGVTKERVRQIEARALSKLRKAAEEEQIEFPD